MSFQLPRRLRSLVLVVALVASAGAAAQSEPAAPQVEATTPVVAHAPVAVRVAAPAAAVPDPTIVDAPASPAPAAPAPTTLPSNLPATAPAAAVSTALPSTLPATGAVAPSYRGANRFWFPKLGITQKVYGYACGRTSALAHVVYRWGCAGSNNVYLMAHASSKFFALYDAHRDGRLKKGMLAVYGDAAGRVHYYRLKAWKVMSPRDPAGIRWAITPSTYPNATSMLTLQTCTGPGSSRRLVVRFLEVAKP